MSQGLLDEDLAFTLLSRFLNHLEAADVNEIATLEDKEMFIERPAGLEDAILRNLLSLAKYFSDAQIKWQKRKEDTEEQGDGEAPLAIVVLIDKVGKIGRKAKTPSVIACCLKFHAATLVSQFVSADQDAAMSAILRLAEYVQSVQVSSSRARQETWIQCGEMAKMIVERLQALMGDERFTALQVELLKTLSASRNTRKEAERLEAIRDPEMAAARRNAHNRHKRDVKKAKSKAKVRQRQ